MAPLSGAGAAKPIIRVATGGTRTVPGAKNKQAHGPFGIMRLSVAYGDTQSPYIFCLSSRRCCASSGSVAVGRASRRGMPIGSPVSSHQP